MKLYPILEYTIGECTVLGETIVDEKSNDKTMRVEVVWQVADKINTNGRLYPRTILEKNIGEINNRIKEKKTVYGSSFHPRDGIGDAHDVTHIWESVEMNEDGICTGILKVLPTSKGKEIQTILREGGYIGISSRGFGTTTKIEKEVEGKKISYLQINEDFKLQSPGDFVLAPSVSEAGVRAVLESLNKMELQLKAEDSEENKEEVKLEKKDKKEEETKVESKEEAKEETKVESKEETKVESEELDALKEKISDLEKAVEEKDASLKEKDEEIERMKAELAKFEAFAEKLGKDVLDILPESEKEEEEVEEEVEESEVDKLKKENEDLKTKVEEFESEKKAKAEAEKKAKAEAELQEKLKAKVDETLKDEKYKVYESVIRDRITKDEKITIESEDAVESEIEKLHAEISEIAVKAKNAEIGKTGIEEIGKIENPEGEEKSASEKNLKEQYNEAVSAGFRGSFEKFKTIQKK